MFIKLDVCHKLIVTLALSWDCHNIFSKFVNSCLVYLKPFSALTLLVGRQEGIRPVKNWVMGCWHGCLSGTMCRRTVSCFSKIQIGFTFLVPAHLGSLDKGVCVCLVYLYHVCIYGARGNVQTRLWLLLLNTLTCETVYFIDHEPAVCAY